MNEVNYIEFNNVVLSQDKSLVLFYADWCPYCRSFKPIFESKEDPDNQNYTFYSVKLNEEENPLWDEFNIDSVPTIIAFEKDKMVSRRNAKMGIGLSKSDIDSLLLELKWS
ncbi:MAG: thioredoxin family protein [Nitrososphaeraceae archaeon]